MDSTIGEHYIWNKFYVSCTEGCNNILCLNIDYLTDPASSLCGRVDTVVRLADCLVSYDDIDEITLSYLEIIKKMQIQLERLAFHSDEYFEMWKNEIQSCLDGDWLKNPYCDIIANCCELIASQIEIPGHDISVSDLVSNIKQELQHKKMSIDAKSVNINNWTKYYKSLHIDTRMQMWVQMLGQRLASFAKLISNWEFIHEEFVSKNKTKEYWSHCHVACLSIYHSVCTKLCMWMKDIIDDKDQEVEEGSLWQSDQCFTDLETIRCYLVDAICGKKIVIQQQNEVQKNNDDASNICQVCSKRFVRGAYKYPCDKCNKDVHAICYDKSKVEIFSTTLLFCPQCQEDSLNQFGYDYPYIVEQKIKPKQVKKQKTKRKKKKKTKKKKK
eukprot:106504_1